MHPLVRLKLSINQIALVKDERLTLCFKIAAHHSLLISNYSNHTYNPSD